MPVWGIVKTAAPRCHGQLDVLLPEAERCIELSTVPRGSSLSIPPNSHEITLLLPNLCWKSQCLRQKMLAQLARDIGTHATSVHTKKTFTVSFRKEILPNIDEKKEQNKKKKKLIEKSRECHNHKPQPTPDTKRKRKMTKTSTYKTNKQVHEKHTDQLPLPQARWSQC